MKKNIKMLYIRGRLATIVGLVALSLLIPNIVFAADEPQQPTVSGWFESIGDGDESQFDKGFGNNNNIAIRGMIIYKDELYVGTQNQGMPDFSDPVLNEELALLTGAQSSMNQNQGLAQISKVMQLASNDNLNQIMQPALTQGQQTAVSQQTMARSTSLSSQSIPAVGDDDDDGYDPHYMFSPDGGEHVYYLPAEIIGMDGLSDDFLSYILEKLQGLGLGITEFMRVLLGVGSFFSDGCEIWKYNYSTDEWTQVVGENGISNQEAGFGYNHNYVAGAMEEFNDALYAGTWSTPIGAIYNPDRKGCEIYRTEDGITWEQVVGLEAFQSTGQIESNGGFGNPDNMGVSNMEVYDGYLYVGTMNFDFTDNGGCEVWRSSDGEIWENVVDQGFRPFMSDEDLENDTNNVYAWEMKSYNGGLYVGTANSHALVVPSGTPEWLVPAGGPGYGCQLWRIDENGVPSEVDLPGGDGFGERQNEGIRRMRIYDGLLYVGVAAVPFSPIVNPDEACEVWTYDSTGLDGWHNIAGEEAAEEHPLDVIYEDGFGNSNNKYPWSMAITSDGVWIGTFNKNGCQVVDWDGADWTFRVHDGDYEMPAGFDDLHNTAVRSMIEYPEGSGIIVAGTFTGWGVFPEGCEVWIRYP